MKQPRITRKTKMEQGIAPTPKPNEVSKVFNKLNQFIYTPKQEDFSNTIHGNIITFVNGTAGCGKTSVTLKTFLEYYLKDNSLNLIIIRTPAEVGCDKIGFLPDGIDAKLEPHFASTRKILEDFIGKGKLEADLGKRIHFTIPNMQLGATWDNSLVLIDEAQLLQPIIMKLLLERIGENTKVVVSGSSSQIYTSDHNTRSGMNDAIGKFFNKEKEPLFDNIEYFEFTSEDTMRSDIVKSVLKAYGE